MICTIVTSFNSLHKHVVGWLSLLWSPVVEHKIGFCAFWVSVFLKI